MTLEDRKALAELMLKKRPHLKAVHVREDGAVLNEKQLEANKGKYNTYERKEKKTTPPADDTPTENDDTPTEKWTVDKIKEYMTEQSIEFDEKSTKKDLLKKIEEAAEEKQA